VRAMGEMITLTAADGFQLAAYKAEPAGQPRGGVVVIQEIFGVNDHVRSVADLYAANGYVAIAPALFDRVGPGIELGYADADMQAGAGIAFGKLDQKNTLADITAAVAEAGKAGKVGVVGYCWGGLQTALATIFVPGVAAGSSYYGGGIGTIVDQTPKVPLMCHFAEKDGFIPLSDVEKVKAAWPDAIVYVYEGVDHGFNCDHRGVYDETAAALARSRTLEFFAKHVG